jgi:hypothetical protein
MSQEESRVQEMKCSRCGCVMCDSTFKTCDKCRAYNKARRNAIDRCSRCGGQLPKLYYLAQCKKCSNRRLQRGRCFCCGKKIKPQVIGSYCEKCNRRMV